MLVLLLLFLLTFSFSWNLKTHLFICDLISNKTGISKEFSSFCLYPDIVIKDTKEQVCFKNYCPLKQKILSSFLRTLIYCSPILNNKAECLVWEGILAGYLADYYCPVHRINVSYYIHRRFEKVFWIELENSDLSGLELYYCDLSNKTKILLAVSRKVDIISNYGGCIKRIVSVYTKLLFIQKISSYIIYVLLAILASWLYEVILKYTHLKR